MMNVEPLFHLVPFHELRSCIRGSVYVPARFADDGFIHCTAGVELTETVARDYFSPEEDLIVLRINPAGLRARLVWEAAAPIEGGGTEHLKSAAVFPHIYGELNLDCVTAARMLREDGRFRLPESFGRLDDILA